MRILAFSDLHMSKAEADRLVTASKEADLVIGAGDFCNMRNGLRTALKMLRDIKAPFVTVPGNNESADELRDAALPGMEVLHGQELVFDDLTIFGLGYGIPATPFGAWSCDLSEVEATELLRRCDHADILVTHSPPKGVADRTSDGKSVGSTALHHAIERLQPRLAVFGHVHDSWGISGKIGQTHVQNLGPVPNWFEI